MSCKKYAVVDVYFYVFNILNSEKFDEEKLGDAVRDISFK